jgi:hypothetical protein
MVALVLLFEVEAPVGLEVIAGFERAQFQDGLGSLDAPARPCHLKPVLDQIGPARKLLVRFSRSERVLRKSEQAGCFCGASTYIQRLVA